MQAIKSAKILRKLQRACYHL